LHSCEMQDNSDDEASNQGKFVLECSDVPAVLYPFMTF
jgi:hypothetical protein